MDQVWKSEMNFCSENVESSQLIQNNLSMVSSDVIKSLKEKTNFYLAHYLILSRKNNCESSGLKVIFLRKLHHILDKEIKNRVKRILL